MNTTELFETYGMKWRSTDDRGDTLAKLIRSNKYWDRKMKRIIKGNAGDIDLLKAELSKSLLSRFGRVRVEEPEKFYNHFPKLDYTAKLPKNSHEAVSLLVSEQTGSFNLSYGFFNLPHHIKKGRHKNGGEYFETMFPKIAKVNQIKKEELGPIVRKARQEMERAHIEEHLTYNFFECLIEDYQNERERTNPIIKTISFVRQMAAEVRTEKGKEEIG